MTDRVSFGILHAVRRLVPPERHRWVDALIGELSAIESPHETFRFAISGAGALLRDSVVLQLDLWMRDRLVWSAAIVTGLLVGVIDLASPTRWPLRILLTLSALAFARLRPVAAWRWGLGLGAGLPLLALATGFRGPYAFDRADSLYLAPPVIVLT